MKISTKIAHLGRDPRAHQGVVNPPVYHTSTILFETHADYKKAQAGTYEHSSYGRYGTASNRALEDALAELEGADYAFLVPSGMSAIATTLLALLNAGDHLLMPDNAYGSARVFCDQELSRFGITTEYYDPMIGAGIAAKMLPNTKVIFVESPGSLTFEIQDIPAIAGAAHAGGALVVADSTYGSPLLCRPLELGADVSLYSVSKYISGHSDLMMGVVCAKGRAFARLIRTQHHMGNTPGPDDIYLAQRGLRTLEVRLRQHEEQALKVARCMKSRPEVATILHPAFAECPGHDIWQRDFKGSNGLFSVLLHPVSETALSAMLDGMKLFKMGYSWGGYESLMTPFDAKRQRSVTQWTHDGPGLRLHVGLESIEDLIADLEAGFARLQEAQKAAA